MTHDQDKHITLTGQNFHKEVLESDQPVLVDFWAPWCGPCQTMNPVIRDLAEEYDGKVVVGKVNVDEQPHTAAQYRIQSIPTLLVFRNGQVVDQAIGAVTRKVLTEKLDAALGTNVSQV